jgi:anaerobic magnesium-protoporphyrin IX monomethyl ester cyclase
MKFLFVQKNSFPAAGPMIISALLKKHGHDVDLLLAAEEKNLVQTIVKMNPDVLGIPCFTDQYMWPVEIFRRVKKLNPKILTLLGGPHPTYYPDIINESGVDAIVRGEAEYAILELMERLKKKESLSGINGIWIKHGSAVEKNDIACLPADLNELPLPDREIYYKYKFLKNVSAKQFLSGRGCPFQCSFCANNILKKLYQGKGKFLRRRDPEGVVQEILDVKKKYGLKTVSFTDDVFIINEEWLKIFLPRYKAVIGLPFMCNVTANLVTEDIARLLKDNGCYGVSMGIESGNEKIRREVLQKNISNDQIIVAAKLVKKYGLLLKTYNILCLPEETVLDALETLELNAKIKSDFAACSLLQPYPDYDITEYAKKRNFLPADYGLKDIGGGIYRSSPLTIRDKNQFVNLQKLFFLGVKMPWTIPLIKKLIKFPPNFLFDLVGKSMYGLFMSRVHKLTWKDILNYALHVDPYDV